MQSQVGTDDFAATAFDEPNVTENPYEHLQNLIEQIEFIVQIGLDTFEIVEHHLQGFLDSAPAIILAVAAVRTKNLRLTIAVTGLSATADPVCVFQEFAALIFYHKVVQR